MQKKKKGKKIQTVADSMLFAEMFKSTFDMFGHSSCGFCHKRPQKGIVPSYGFYVLNFIGIDVKHASSSDHPRA